MPPEKHISVDTSELVAAIKNRLELADRPLFYELCKLMAGVAQFDFYDLKSRLRNNFVPFDANEEAAVCIHRQGMPLCIFQDGV